MFVKQRKVFKLQMFIITGVLCMSTDQFPEESLFFFGYFFTLVIGLLLIVVGPKKH